MIKYLIRIPHYIYYNSRGERTQKTPTHYGKKNKAGEFLRMDLQNSVVALVSIK